MEKANQLSSDKVSKYELNVRVKPLGKTVGDVININEKFADKLLKGTEGNKIIMGSTNDPKKEKIYDFPTHVLHDD